MTIFRKKESVSLITAIRSIFDPNSQLDEINFRLKAKGGSTFPNPDGYMPQFGHWPVTPELLE
jgi:hypothetical protein